jgi:hypothetical protein
MGQLTSNQAGRRSRDDRNISSLLGSLETKFGLENSLPELSYLSTSLEVGNLDITRWKPQQLATTYHSNGVHPRETPGGRPKISISSRDAGIHRTPPRSECMKISKERNEEKSCFLFDARSIHKDEGDLTESPTELTNSKTSKKGDNLWSAAHNASLSAKSQESRKSLLREVRRLLHSASLDDMARIASYLKTQGASRVQECKCFFGRLEGS